MDRPSWVRPAAVAFAVVMAIVSAALGVWWTFAAMVLLAASYVSAALRGRTQQLGKLAGHRARS